LLKIKVTNKTIYTHIEYTYSTKYGVTGDPLFTGRDLLL